MSTSSPETHVDPATEDDIVDVQSDAETETALVKVDPQWLAPREATSLSRWSRLGRFTHHIAADPEDSPAFAHLSAIASELRRKSGDATSCSIAVTSPGRGNGQGRTAIGLATIWARWKYPTLLVDVSSYRHSEISRMIDPEAPSLSDLIEAYENGHDLPAPQTMNAPLENLDVLSNLNHWSLAHLADTGRLAFLYATFRRRYRRVVWMLPPIGRTWSAAMMGRFVDHVVAATRRGVGDRRPVIRLADQLRDMGHNPLQLVWHT